MFVWWLDQGGGFLERICRGTVPSHRIMSGARGCRGPLPVACPVICS